MIFVRHGDIISFIHNKSQNHTANRIDFARFCASAIPRGSISSCAAPGINGMHTTVVGPNQGFSLFMIFVGRVFHRRFVFSRVSIPRDFSFHNMATTTEVAASHNFNWQQTMLRIKDPLVTVPFYESHFGFQMIHKYDFPQWKFSLYFMAILPEGVTAPAPNTQESEAFLWNLPKGISTLELTHNHGSENDASFAVNNGNEEPHRGFGHIAVMTPDVYAVSEELEAAGVKFRKRPDEGRMKGLAFCLCPDGYWIEIVKRGDSSPVKTKYSLAQTMIRVKDPKKSLHFYQNLLGMNLLRESHKSDFSLYFLSHAPIGSSDKDTYEPVIELTHNHGTEDNDNFSYHNGNAEENGALRGFGHLGFLVDDLDKACEFLEKEGCIFKKKPKDGNMHNLAFVYDPDGYWVELIQRGFAM